MYRRENEWDQQLLQSIWTAPLEQPNDFLLLRDMCLVADEQGHAALATLATRFRNFYRKRRLEGKSGEMSGNASEQSIDCWEREITGEILPRHRDLYARKGEYLIWNPECWVRWSPGFRKAVRHIAEIRLIEWFEKNVPGGY